MAELFNDLHQLKRFTQTQQDFKNNDALRLEHHDTPVLLAVNVDEPKENMGNIEVVPSGREILYRTHLLELVELEDERNDQTDPLVNLERDIWPLLHLPSLVIQVKLARFVQVVFVAVVDQDEDVRQVDNSCH